jgi:anti-anti-sigma factor
MGSLVQLVRDLWRAYEAGGLDAFLEAAGEDVVWQPHVTDGRVFHTTAELRETLAALTATGVRYEPKLHDLEQHGDVVLVHGVLRVSRNGSVEEAPVHWAYHFRAGRLRRQATYASREDALEALAALRLLAGSAFTVAEDPGSDGERVIRVHGELDIDTVPELERALLRSRPARSRVVLDLGELKFMDSTGLRVLLRARAAAEEGHWELFLRDVPSNVRRLFDMAGVNEALPREAP